MCVGMYGGHVWVVEGCKIETHTEHCCLPGHTLNIAVSLSCWKKPPPVMFCGRVGVVGGFVVVVGGVEVVEVFFVVASLFSWWCLLCELW